jgi:hypothetical protein
VHRFPARTGGDRDVVSGLPLSMGPEAEPLPEGTRVHWDFGDGGAADGPRVTHAWARAGEYQVHLEVSDASGVRRDQATVRVARRPPLAAVPPSARAALVFDRFFSRLPQHIAVADRLAGPETVRELLDNLEALLGFDASRPEQVLASGFDPEKGLAAAWLPGDTGTWLIVGVHEERAALEAARSALARRAEVTFSPGPSGTILASVGKSRIHFLVRGGYLYAHLAADEGVQPRLDLVLASPDEGLSAEPLFARARPFLEGDDVLAFVRGSEIPEHQALAGEAAVLRAHATALAASLINRESELSLTGRVFFDPEGEAALHRAFAGATRLPLDTRAPAGAVGYLSLSLSSDALAGWLTGGDHQDLDAALTESAGLDLSTIGALAAGAAAVAAYFDVATVLQQILAGAGPGNLDLVAGLSLRDPQAARVRLEAAAKEGRLRPAGTLRWETTRETAATVALVGDHAFFGHAVQLDKVLKGDEKRTLSQTLRAALPPDALAPGHQLLFLDVASFIDQLRNPHLPGDDSIDQVRAQHMATMLTAMVEATPQLRPLLPVRDAYVDLWSEGTSLALRARLRFR